MPEIIKIDDFAPDAAEVRAAVVAGGFKTERGPDGADYTGISQFPVPQWHELIEKHVGFPIIPRMSFFRFNMAGELPHSWVHSDDICAKYASILYLNTPEQCQGGTAFWRHIDLGLDRLPSDEELRADGIDIPAFHAMMTKEWKTLGSWYRWNFMPMKWNRFVTYPTCLFHSRYPFEAFGQGAEDGRLIWVCFYDMGAK